jgi:hypothetical protein
MYVMSVNSRQVDAAKMLPIALPFVNTHVLKFFAELALSNVRLFRFAHNNRERSSE